MFQTESNTHHFFYLNILQSTRKRGSKNKEMYISRYTRKFIKTGQKASSRRLPRR